MFQTISPLLNCPVNGAPIPLINFLLSKLTGPATVKANPGSGCATPTVKFPCTVTVLE